jgi:protoheme IX farnesyltransferase
MTKFLDQTKDVLKLTKAEIVLLEAITLTAGFFIGHPMELPINWSKFSLSLFGVSALALAAGALNQIQEKSEDSQMARTRNRPLPSGRVTLVTAWVITLLLMGLGILLLSWISMPVLALGLLAVISYNGLYTLWWKRKMAFAAIPGAIPGALPIWIGFVAASGSLTDLRGYYLFAILFFWQMPHFWVLALKYSDDYLKGGFPTLPVAKGTGVTRFQITLWCLAYAALGLLSPLFFPVGILGVSLGLLTSLWLIFELLWFLYRPGQKTWLRFFLSINFSMLAYLFAITADLWSILIHPRS